MKKPAQGRQTVLENSMRETRKYWPLMTFYERFEQIVALTLTALISLIIIVALWRLASSIIVKLLFEISNPLDHAVFQSIFGMIMTLLIAMEFKHSIRPILERKAAIVQVRTIMLIAMLAVSRKFIILDIQTTSAWTVAALAVALVAIGTVYWLLRRESEGNLP